MQVHYARTATRCRWLPTGRTERLQLGDVALGVEGAEGAEGRRIRSAIAP
jgi:hypothetical protein